MADREIETRKRWAAGATRKPKQADIKGKIIEYLWYLKKQGYAKTTAKRWTECLRRLANEGADLLDPESVKEAIARHDDWKDGYKLTFVNAYGRFAKALGIEWDRPTYKRVGELPFIPLEKEIDALIASCGKKTSTALQLMKETAMRIGEVGRLRWIDVDEERNVIRCRSEKHGNPRIFKVSNKLMAMLNALPKKSDLVFGGVNINGFRSNFVKKRRRVASKLQNPRIKRIAFHTLRHWKATMEYHRTKDILYVKRLLGHRRLDSTLVYTQLIDFEPDDNFTCRIAGTLEEAKELIEAGFDYVTDMEDVKLFRKRK